MAAAETKTPCNVVVVGAGLAGLLAAWRLASHGHKVTVLERRAGLPDGGGDIQISPNGTHLLRKMGLAEALEPLMNPRPYFVARRAEDYSIICERPIDIGAKTPSLMCRRHELSKLLLKLATQVGAAVRFGVHISSIDEGKPSVTLEDGEELVADLVIAADGVGSQARSMVFQDHVTKPVAIDEVCFHWFVPRHVMEEDHRTKVMWEEAKQKFVLVCGNGNFCGYWSNVHTDELYFVCTQKGYTKPADVGNWTKSADMNEMRELFRGYSPPVSIVMDKATVGDHWRIASSIEGADWTSPSGKVILIGDAIHAMPPNAAQGLAQCLEDTAALGVFLDSIESVTDIPRMMKGFGQVRKHRVDKVMSASKNNSTVFSLPPGPGREARDQAWGSFTVNEDVVKRWNEALMDPDASAADFNFLKWIAGYDAVAAAEEYITLHKSSL